MNADRLDQLGELLSAYLDDELSAKERARVEQLLATDPQARALLGALRETAEAVRALPTERAPEHISAALQDRLEREVLLAAADPDATLARHRRPPVRATFAIAAMLAVAIGGGLYVSLRQARQADEGYQVAHADRKAEDYGLLRSQVEPFAERDGDAGRQLAARSSPAEPASPQPERTIDAIRPAGEPDRGRSSGKAEPSVDSFAQAGREDTGGPPIEPQPTDAAELFGRAARKLVESLEGQELGTPAANSIGLADADAPSALELVQRGEIAGELVVEAADDVSERKVASATNRRSRGSAEQEESTLTTAAVGESVMVGGGPGAAPAGTTLEQLLESSADLGAARAHAFDAEPLRVSVRFARTSVVEAYWQRIIRLLELRGVAPLEDLLSESTANTAPSRPTLVMRVARDAVAATHVPFYVRGTSGTNFTPDTSGERQLLARVAPDWLLDVLDEAAAADADAVVLNVGALTMNGPEQARSLAMELCTAEPGVAVAQPGRGSTGLPIWFDWLSLIARQSPPDKQPAPGIGPAEPGDDDGSVSAGARVTGTMPPESSTREARGELITVVVEMRLVEEGPKPNGDSPSQP